jgi:PAS domain S-box-containing protein
MSGAALLIGLVVGAGAASAWFHWRAGIARREADAIARQLRECRAMVDHTNDAVLMVEARRIVECNPAAESLFGIPRAELLGSHPATLSPEIQPGGGRSEDLANANIARAMGGEPQRFLWEHTRRGSGAFTAEVALAPAFQRDAGEAPRFVAVLRDVTQARRAAEALQASEQQFRSLFELAPVPLALTTPQGQLIDFNRQWIRVLGYDRHDVPTMTEWWQKAYPDPAYRQAVQAIWDKAIGRVLHEGRELQQTEVRLTCKTGEVRTMRVGGALVGDAILTSYVDVTELRQAQQALEALNAGLEQRVGERTHQLESAIEHLHRTQDELVRSEKLASLGALVAGVAHELNTPIGNAVIVASTLADQHKRFAEEVASGLKRSSLTRFIGEVQEGVDVMERNLRRAAELITGFKQVAVDQSSHQRRRFDLREIVHELTLTLSPTLRRAGVTFTQDVPPDVTLDSYPGPLGQVIMNVVNNAVVHAFGQQDQPRIDARGQVEDGWLTLTLSDNGCGISPDHLARVFDPFFTTRLGQGGSGLGMHIVYSLVTELLGGSVHLDSTLGVGTTVTLRIPLQAPQPVAPESAAHA